MEADFVENRQISEICWETTYEAMMNEAHKIMEMKSPNSEVVVLKNQSGQYFCIGIPDIMDNIISELRENLLIKQLIKCGDTRVMTCLCTMNGEYPEIPSWHLRSRLAEINPENLQTKTFLWGGGEDIIVKPFSALLPLKKKESK